jgi:hypothetical protein
VLAKQALYHLGHTSSLKYLNVITGLIIKIADNSYLYFHFTGEKRLGKIK